MGNYKFKLNQRVNTPIGEGVIDTMPYNETTGVYGIWLDKPYYNNGGVNEGHWKPVLEKHITAL